MTSVAIPRAAGRSPRAHLSLILLRSRRFAAGALLLQAMVLTLVEARHKPWFDEAQAWLLARDTGPVDLLVHHLRYEGSPGLWHLVLMGPAKLGLPYRTIGFVSIAATLVGAAILLYRSPLPRLLAVMVCFSFFPFYQYGVVARSYCLMAPLMFLIAAGWRRRLDHPVRLFVLLALLANVSLHGTLIAMTLAALHLAGVRRAWPALDRETRRRQLRPALVFGIVVLTVVAELYPPRDLIGGGSWHLTAPWAMFGNPLVARQLPVILPTLAIVGISMWWFWTRRCLLLFALPAGALLTLFLVRYFSPWHAGTIFLVWVFALWVGLESPPREPRAAPRARRVMFAASGLALAGQLVWTAMAVAYESSNSYSGSADVAAYIQDHHLDSQRIDLIGKWGVGVLPYFSRDIFANYNSGRGPAYFPWSSQQPLPGHKSDVLLDDPDLIVVAVKSASGPSRLACLPGYRLEQEFAGGIYWPGGVMESESFAVYRRSAVDGERWYWGTCGLL